MNSKVMKALLLLLLLGAVSATAEQWEYMGLSGMEVLSIETHPAQPRCIVAGTNYDGMRVTFDGGQNWGFRLATNVPIPFISYEPRLADSLFAIVGDSYSMGLYISADNGNIWHRVSSVMYPRRMAFDPINPGFLYICFQDGIMTSEDYGHSLTSANNGLPGLNILDIKGDGTNQYEAYSVGEAFVAHTTDFGISWEDMGGLFGLEDYNPSRIKFEPNGPETLYVSCWAYVARSFDRGATWEYTSTSPVTYNMAIACDPIVAGKLYVGSLGGGVLKSTDAGASFTPFNDNLGNLDVYCLKFDPQGRLLAGTSSGVYVYSFGTDIVNEFLASNTRTIQDEEEEFEDYIELYNDSINTIDLNGFFLSDNSADLTKWMFPDTSIQPGEFILIWADNDIQQGPLHANFELNADGEEVVLTMPDGISIVDYISFWHQREDVSMGRFPDGSAYIQPMVPTPEAQNSGNIPPYLDYIERVPVDPEEGQQVTVTCRSYDEDGDIDRVLLYYDSGTGYVEVEMLDDGAHGDGDSLDTVFGGFIPGFDEGTVVNYYMVAFDMDGACYYDPRQAPDETYSYNVGGFGCDYVPGDINGDDDVMGNDVTYGIRYFKGIGAPPPDSCWNDSTSSWLYSGGDANGNCTFTGSDVTFLVAYFKGHNPEILWCPQTPPISPGYEHEEIRGDCIDELTADADSGYMVLEVIGNDLHIHHMSAFYQCCLDYFVDYLIVDYDITAFEYDLGEYCWCLCFFNLESILYDLQEGFYTVRLIGIYGDTVGVDTVTVGGRY